MKLMFTLLAIFMLFLACLPCRDSRECSIAAEASISTSTDHQQHTHDSEECNPFCTCSCCAATVYSPNAKTLASIPSYSSREFQSFNICFQSEAYYSIWQPPQLIS